jgi:hypothetical protein
MSRSFISSSKVMRVRWPVLIRLALVTLALLLAADLIWRFWRPVHTANGWLNRNLAGKMDGMIAKAGKSGKLDVVVLSTSVGKGVDVDRWELASGGELNCWNGAVPGLRPQQIYFLLRGVLLPKVEIKNIVHLVTPQDLSIRGGLQVWEHRKHGQFFDSWRMRAAAAETPTERIKSLVLSMSAFSQDRSAFRGALQGLNAVSDEEWYRTPGGMAPPSLQRLPNPVPKNYLGWIRAVPGANAVHEYKVAVDGELRMVREIAALCREKGVSYTVVSYPWSPWGRGLYSNRAAEEAEFHAALDGLRREGITVLDADRDLNLDDSHFEDAWHDNRWGSESTTAYLYEKVVRPAYPNPSWPQTIEPGTTVKLNECQPAPPVFTPAHVELPQLPRMEARHEATMLTRLEPGQGLILNPEAAPGTWVVDVYGAHWDKESVASGKHSSGSVGLEPTIGPESSMAPGGWGLTLQRQTFVRLRTQLTTTGPLVLRTELAPVLLDSAFVVHGPNLVPGRPD